MINYNHQHQVLAVADKIIHSVTESLLQHRMVMTLKKKKENIWQVTCQSDQYITTNSGRLVTKITAATMRTSVNP